MTEEILNLLNLAACVMTQTGARSPKVMRSNTRQTARAAGGRHNGPDPFGLNPIDTTRPALLIERNMGPAGTAAAVSQA